MTIAIRYIFGFVILSVVILFLFYALAQDKTNTTNLLADDGSEKSMVKIEVPSHLLRLFPNTDWSKADPALENALSGGPTKDGIPALENPTFIPVSEFEGSNDIQAIVLNDGDEKKIYPYNILVWHEIVNDTVNGTPVAVTFCPLCGSAIVYDRGLPDGQVSTLGVSGSLLESNMIMYDRTTESLWQQSTGIALAGTYHEVQLRLVPFQLLTLGEIRSNYPDAAIMSTDTGYRRDYERNPYAGYETNNQFVFEPSDIDTTFNPKSIMVVFRVDDSIATVSWDTIRSERTKETVINDRNILLQVDEKNELFIEDTGGIEYPFYFEMWFSVAAQHDDILIIE